MTNMPNKKYAIRQKDKTAAVLLAFFLGGFGIHKFYLGRTFAGVMYLVFFWTFIPAFLAWIDIIMLLCMDRDAFDQAYNGQ
jgi:TM2 domain-containing membrane protein YozV